MFRCTANNTKPVFLILVALSFCLVSCATRKSRIDENLSKFTAYPPEIQMKIQNGEIDKGFTEDMVYMAKGQPDVKSKITKKTTTVDIWKYPLPYSSAAGGDAQSAGLSGAYSYPTFGTGSPGAAMGPANTHAVVRRAFLIVEFEKGKVTGWSESK